MKPTKFIRSECSPTVIHSQPGNVSHHRSLFRVLAVWMLLAGSALLAPVIQAQTNLTIKPIRQHLEVPAGTALTYYVTPCAVRIPTNGAAYATNYVDPINGPYTNWVIAAVNISISGAPAGCTASIVCSDLSTPVGPVTVNLNTNNAATTTNVVVKLVFDGTQSSGTASLDITATGGGLPQDDFFLPLDIGKLWNGSANAALNGAGEWSDAAQWRGGVPGASDEVVFTDVGAQTNSLLNGTTYLTNSFVGANMTIASLRFSQTNSAANYHNLFISPNVNLTIAGSGGFSMLRDYNAWNAKMFVSIYGTNGTLIQNNENSAFNFTAGDYKQQSVLDMSGLGNLHLDVNVVNIDNYQGYPNYTNMVYSNNFTGTGAGSGKPQGIYGTWKMAATNYIKATYVDAYNYTNAQSRSYALTVGRNDGSGGSSGQDAEVYLGYSNVFNLDSICVAGTSCYGADFRFLNSGSYAKFRNADGVNRMSMFATADLGGQLTEAQDKSKCGGNGPGVDFGKGTVDMLVDRLCLSLDGTNATGGYSQTSGFDIAAGIIDANTVIIGYQSQGNATQASTCYGTLTVSNTAVLKANNTLTLGYTTAANASSAGASYGKLVIASGGAVWANNIGVGGPAKTSVGNEIDLSGNATLVVSNSIADATANGALGTLSLSGGNNSIKLFIDGANSSPLIFVSTLSYSGTGNRLVIGGVKNLTYPADVVIAQGGVSASAFDAGVTMPPGSGLFGSLNTSGNTIVLHIINRIGNHLVWRGPGTTADWDYTTLNWMDQATHFPTNYDNPDTVAFDDAAGVATNVNLAGAIPLTPTAINMTNSANYFTFLNGPNSLSGPLNKYGNGTLEVDGNTALGVTLNQGFLTGSGSLGSVNVAPGAAMYCLGDLSGSLLSAGVATSSGTISGTLTVSSGGVVTNAGTCNGGLSVLSGGFLYNSGTLVNVGVGSSGLPQVSSGGVFVNNGAIGAANGGDVLYVNGEFEDIGGLSDNLKLQSLSIGSGGTFIPGGDGIGVSTINSDGSGTYPGALLLVQGATNILKVNLSANPQNTEISASHISFGASASAQSQLGATLIITNVGSVPFSAGQTLHLFDNTFASGTIPDSTGTSSNTFPLVIPPPGPGLAWDLRHLWAPDNNGNSGNIAVVSANSGPTLTNSFAVAGTNLFGQFSWDQSYQGYRLVTQVNPLSVGLSNNWTTIAGSWTNTTVLLTNVLGSGAVFYELVFP